MKSTLHSYSMILGSVIITITAILSSAETKVLPTDGSSGAQFGTRSSSFSTNIAIAAGTDSENGSKSGAVYIFSRDDTNMTELAKLTASDGAAYDRLGSDVSIYSNLVVAGAIYANGSVSDCGAAYLYVKPAGGWSNMTETAKLTASDGANGNLMGNAVEYFDDCVMVGAYSDNDKGGNSGSIYVFDKPAGGWSNMTESAKITASDGASGDQFGYHIRIDGDYMITSSVLDDDKGYNSGSAYIFKLEGNNWVEKAKLTASDGSANDLYGWRVGISGDYAIVASKDDDNGTGAVYVYKRSGEIWTEDAKLTATDNAVSDYLGHDISINGTRVLAGAYCDDDNGSNSGAGYVFETDGTNWSQAYKLLPNDGATEDRLGTSVSIIDNIAIVGAIWDDDNGDASGSAYLFDILTHINTAPPAPPANKFYASDGDASDQFGGRLMVHDDYLVVAARTDEENGSNSGSLYVYKLNGDDLVQVAKLTASDGASQDRLGAEVAIFGDVIVADAIYGPGVSADTGAVYLYQKPPNGWSNMTETAKLYASDGQSSDYFGNGLDIWGDVVVAGAYSDDDMGNNAGAMYVFKKPAGGWSNMTETAKITASDGQADDQFGYRVSIFGDYLITGACLSDEHGTDSGSAYIFKRDGENWIEDTKLIPSDGSTDALFGWDVDTDGQRAVIAALREDSDTGSVYVYKRDGDSWTLEDKILAEDKEAGDQFGHTVEIFDNYIFTGSWREDTKGNDAGAAYVFRLDGTNWVQDEKIMADDGEAGDNFGTCVTLMDNYVIVGSDRDSDKGSAAGSCYIYDVNIPPVCIASATPTNGPAPLAVTFDISSSYDPDGEIVRWEIDKDGDGTFETGGDELGTFIIEYPASGTFKPIIKVIDDDQAEAMTSLDVKAWGNPPVAVLAANPSSGSAPLPISLIGTNSSATIGHNIVAYEWDFDSDGSYDMLSTTGVVSTTYRSSGDHVASLRITDDQGLQSTAQTIVNVTEPLNPPTVTLSSDVQKGTIPMVVYFTADITDDGSVTNFMWDVDGDGDVDLTSTTNTLSYTYKEIGLFDAQVTVIDNDGLSDSSRITISAEEPSFLRTWIQTPKDGKRVQGQQLQVSARARPHKEVASVQLQYKLSSNTNWTDLGNSKEPSPHAYFEHWDVSGFTGGTEYDLRSVATGLFSNKVYSSVITVTINSGNISDVGDIEEDIVGDKHKTSCMLNKKHENEVSVYDGTSVLVPADASTTNTILEIELTETNANTINGSAYGKTCINENRKISLGNNPNPDKSLTIDIPYDDDDDDGFVDGTDICEKHLRGHWYDSDSNCWRRALSSEVLSKENIVRIKTYHLTEFGLFGNPNLLLAANGSYMSSAPTAASNTMNAANLTDDNDVSYWQSDNDPSSNQVFIFAFTNYSGAIFNTAIINNYGSADKGKNYYSQDFEILGSMDGASYSQIISTNLTATEGPQEFTFATTTSRWVKLSVSSGTSGQAWSLAEFSLIGSITNDADADLMPDDWEMASLGGFSSAGTNDYDLDGLTDAEEYSYGGNPQQRDSDSDGQNDLDEKIAGTSLTDPSDIFKVTEVATTNLNTDELVLKWSTKPGKLYSVLSTTNILDTNSWTCVPEPSYSNRLGDGSNVHYTNNPTTEYRYYKLKVTE